MSSNSKDQTTRNIMTFLRKETGEPAAIVLTADGQYAIETRIGLAYVIRKDITVIQLTGKTPLEVAWRYHQHVTGCSRMELDYLMSNWFVHILRVFKVMALERRIQRLDRFQPEQPPPAPSASVPPTD